MKKIFLILLAGIIYIAFVPGSAKAQLFVANVTTPKAITIPALAYYLNENSVGDEIIANAKDNTKASKANLKALKASLKAMKANFRAAEYFKREFKDVTDVKWSLVEEGIVATFEKEGSHSLVVYDKRGNWIHTVKYCDESKIPNDIRHLITAGYPDFKITGMNEIREGNITFYVVNIESETRYKEISVCNGNAEEYKVFNKQ